MEGIYENFPDLHHGVAVFSCGAGCRAVQRALIRLFHRINVGGEPVEAPVLSSQGISLFFEIGVADGLVFNFIDDEEMARWVGLLTEDKREIKTLDFILIARYYVSREGRRRPLRFDYYILRFIFGSEALEIRVHHERGTRRLPIDDLLRLLGEKISLELKRLGEAPLRLESLAAF
jgi:hypothetical protein